MLIVYELSVFKSRVSADMLSPIILSCIKPFSFQLFYNISMVRS